MNNIVAVIDVGTNSVLLTIAELSSGGKKIVPLFEGAEITRIGEGLSSSGNISAAAAQRTLNVLKKYKERSTLLGVKKIITIGTAALRKAENSPEFLKIIKKEIGIDIDIISGEREAELTFIAAKTDFSGDITVIDIGGGSTEIVSQTKDGKPEYVSTPLGAVTLYERFIKSDPVSEGDYEGARREILRSLGSLTLPLSPTLSLKGRGSLEISSKLIATAGTATTLAAMKLRLEEYSHSQVHGFVLKKSDIDGIITELKSLTIEERKKLAGLEPKRADVILTGAMLLYAAMELFHFDEVTVSDRGLRWGMLYEVQSLRSRV